MSVLIHFPRRNQLDKMTQAELTIRAAMMGVEDLSADTRLSEAVTLLEKARNLVADVIDEREANA